MKKYITIVYIILTFPQEIQAYVDPNTGGFFFTTVLPFVYGMLAAIVIFWKRIINFVKGIFRKNNKSKE